MKNSNIDAIRALIAEKLGKMKNQNQAFSSNRWKPSTSKTTIRILPYPGRELPLIETYYHYNIGKMKVVLCPEKSIDIGITKTCPICEFAKSLYDNPDLVTEEKRILYGKVKAKLRTSVCLVVRDDEFQENGEPNVKIWEFSPQTYTQMLEYANEEDYELFWDSKNGMDLNVSKTPATTKSPYGEINVLPKIKRTPLAKTDEQIEALLNSIPKIEEICKEIPIEDISNNLNEWLSSGNTIKEETPSSLDNKKIIEKIEEVSNNENDEEEIIEENDEEEGDSIEDIIKRTVSSSKKN